MGKDDWFEGIKKDKVSTAVVIILIMLLGILLYVFFCDDPTWIIKKLGLGETAKYEALKFLGIAMGGVLIALQASISYKRAKAMEDTANAQAKATEHQAKANQNTEQGQRQERLKNAIEHLGHEAISVRLGGAYELFHLAQDTEELRKTVFNILCAHIRQTTGQNEYQENYKEKPSEEIQSLLTLLFVEEYEVFKGLQINLEGSWLKGASLCGAHLEDARLIAAQLQGVDLSRANLQKVDLRAAQLQGAYLENVQMQRATLEEAHLQGAILSSARMQETLLGKAQLQGADLHFARMQGARLGDAKMQGAYLISKELIYSKHIYREPF